MRGIGIPDAAPIMLISREQADEWAGGPPLNDDEYERLAAAIPFSSIPDAIETIVNEAIRRP